MSRRALACSMVATALAAGFGSPHALAVSLGQTDTFASGSTLGWRVGQVHPLPPTVVASGGPGGAGDSYMFQRATGGGGPASHLALENRVQWAGNYNAAGITALTMDVANFGASELSLRLLFDTFSGLRAFSTLPVTVAAGGGWQSLYFPIGAADLSTLSVGGIGSALSQVVSVRVFHSTAAAFPGEAIITSVGIDNITAVAEPAAAWLLLLGLGLLAWRRQTAG